MTGEYFPAGEKLCVNHITVAPGGARCVLLLRNMERRPWKTLVLTADCRGGEEPFTLLDEDMASHYRWVDEHSLLFYARTDGRDGFYTLWDGNRRWERWNERLFAFDGHMSLSPDGRWLSYDSYPDGQGYRRLLLYAMQTGLGYELARLYGPTPSVVDIRCDLHPRWSRDGAKLTFDSIHEGFRGVYAVTAADFPPG